MRVVQTAGVRAFKPPGENRTFDLPGETIGSDHELAAAVAEEAGLALMALRRDVGGSTPDVLREMGDRLSHTLILLRLAEQRPGDAVLSEEGTDDPSRLSSRRVWIVDPLDGTREFGEAERSDWAVHVALVEEGVPVAAAVSLPARRLVISTPEIAAAPSPTGGRLRLMVSRSHTPPEAVAVAELLDAELVHMGSAGAKAMAVLLGEADAYIHLGGQYEWDSAAPVGVALAAGLQASRIDGSPLRYNQPSPWLPDLVICRAEVHDDVLAALRTVIATAAA